MTERFDRFVVAALGALPEAAYELADDVVARLAVSLAKELEKAVTIETTPPPLPVVPTKVNWTRHSNSHLGAWHNGKKVDWYPTTGKLVYNGATHVLTRKYRDIDAYVLTKLPNDRG